MAGHKLRVRVEKIIEKYQVTDKFEKGELVGVIDGEWPETYVFEFPKDKADLLEGIIEGSYVTVHFNYRTNTQEDTSKDAKRQKIYLSLSGWKIEL